jgi:hypothetical protein
LTIDGDHAARHFAAGEQLLSVRGGMLTREMSRHTTFKFCLDPTVGQHEVLSRHAGASRFAFNQCLRIVKTGLTDRRADQDIDVPWTGFDLINAFNAWKKTEDAGRVFTVDSDGVTESVVTGLAWRTEVCQQVFEEAAADLSRGLKAWSDSRSGKRKGRRIGFPTSRERPARPCRFDCVTSTPVAVRPQSGSATTVARTRSSRPVSARSRCATTLADCGACSPTSGRKSCSPPSLVTAGTGGFR